MGFAGDAPAAAAAEGAREGGLRDGISVFPRCGTAPPNRGHGKGGGGSAS
jgi:hypothetical protein